MLTRRTRRSRRWFPTTLPHVTAGAARRAGRGLALVVFVAVALAAAAFAPGAGARAEAAAGPGERADAFLSGAALERFVRKMAPLALQIRGDRASATPPTTLTLVEARYCGTITRGQGRVLAIVTAAGAADAGAPTARLAGENDCQARPGDIANRGTSSAGQEGLAVIEVLVTWVPSQLRFSLGEIATNREGASLGQALARARAAGPVATVDTSAVMLAGGRGAAQSFNLAVTFPPSGRDGVWIAAVPAERGLPAVRDGKPPLDLSPTSPSPSPSEGGDAQVSATYPLANRTLAFFGQDGPLVMQLNGQSVELREIQLDGGEGALTARGKATSRELQETLRLTIDAAGADLKIARVGAEPELEGCADLSALAALGCRARNAARTAAAGAAAAALTNRYRGEPLRTLASSPPETSIELEGILLNLRLTPTRIRATAGGVIVTGKVELERL